MISGDDFRDGLVRVAKRAGVVVLIGTVVTTLFFFVALVSRVLSDARYARAVNGERAARYAPKPPPAVVAPVQQPAPAQYAEQTPSVAAPVQQANVIDCPLCEATGRCPDERGMFANPEVLPRGVCAKCNGTGESFGERCRSCSGSGRCYICAGSGKCWGCSGRGSVTQERRESILASFRNRPTQPSGGMFQNALPNNSQVDQFDNAVRDRQ